MRKRMWLAIAILAAVFGAMTWLTLHDSDAGRVQLPDGRRFAIKAVTFGREHRYVHGSLWAKILARLVPDRWKPRLGVRELDYKTDTPTLMVWGQWRYSQTNSPAQYASVVDGNGLEPPAFHYQSSAWFPPSQVVMGWNFSNYPRRERRFRFRLYSTSSSLLTNMAEIVIANPRTSTATALNSLPLPQRQRENDVEFTLTEFTVGGPMPKSWPVPLLPFSSRTPWNTATFQIAENGNPSPHWKIVSMAVSDATSNSINCRLDSKIFAPAEIRCRFPEVLWPSESSVRLTAEFVRTARFATNEMWTAKGVPVSNKPNRWQPSPYPEIHGMRITSLEVNPAPSGPVAPSALRRTAHLVLRTLPQLRGIRPILLEARDNEDRVVRFEEISLFQNGTLWFALEVPEDATSIDFTLAITRTCFVDFVAKPDRPATARE
jgi:hypothetical protein